MARYSIKPGDIMKVPLSNGENRYFQFLFKNIEQLGGHLIRVFFIKGTGQQDPTPEEIVSAPIDFYTHTRVIEGLKDGHWTKFSNLPIEKDLKLPRFRKTPDLGSGKSYSDQWYLYDVDLKNPEFIGQLSREQRKLPVTGIFPSSFVKKWIETGTHGFKILE